MKIKHIWSVLCKESVINKDDNNVSIHSIIEQLSISLVPKHEMGELPGELGVPMGCEIVSLWQKNIEGESVRGDIEYSLFDSENKELFKAAQGMDFSKTVRRFRSRMKIRGLPLSKSGDYIFKVKLREEGAESFRTVAEIPLEVQVILQKSLVSSRVIN